MSIDERKLPGLYMVWPAAQIPRPSDLELPPGYGLRTYREGDDSDVIELISIEEIWTAVPDGTPIEIRA